MKKMSKIVSMLLAVTLLILSADFATLPAKAAEPLTYSLGYNASLNEWRWQINGTYDPTLGSDEPISKLDSYVKDGDIVVLYNHDTPFGVSFQLSAHLSNLTIIGAGDGVSLPGANGIDEFYALMGSVGAVNSEIKNAYVYDNSRITFNGHVENLEIISPAAVYTVATSTSTIGHAKAYYEDTVFYEVYNVAAGKFVSEYTVLQTEAQYYSTTPTGTAAAATPAAPSTTASAASGEYDDVPKTGEPVYLYMLLGLSLICFLGSRKLRKA